MQQGCRAGRSEVAIVGLGGLGMTLGCRCYQHSRQQVALRAAASPLNACESRIKKSATFIATAAKQNQAKTSRAHEELDPTRCVPVFCLLCRIRFSSSSGFLSLFAGLSAVDFLCCFASHCRVCKVVNLSFGILHPSNSSHCVLVPPVCS